MFKEINPVIDIPFGQRHKCWFCGEISFKHIAVKDERFQEINFDYKKILFPSCEECFNLSKNVKHSSIEEIKQSVKDKMIIKYSKYLAIGSKWTEEELQNSEFSGAALSGFKKSALTMFELIKNRVNYIGWEVCLDGISLGNTGALHSIEFDGVQYSNMIELLNYLSKTFFLDKNFLRKVIDIYGENNIVQAVKYCRLTINFDDKERKLALYDLKKTKEEEEDIILSREQSVLNFNINKDDICEFSINKIIIPNEAIIWAMKRGIITLSDLDNNEGEMFEYFEDHGLSENKIFSYFNALEIYLDKRNYSPSWRSKNDPNIKLWERVIKSVKGSRYFEENFQITNAESKLNDESGDEYPTESLDILMILESIIDLKGIKSGKIINSSQMIEFIIDAGFNNIEEYHLFFDSIYGHDYEEILPEDPFSQYKNWKTWPL